MKIETLNGDAKEAIILLQKIDANIYPNFEYHFHMALAKKQMNQHESAIHHGGISLYHFKETLNFTRCIDAATIQLVSEFNMGKKNLEDLEIKHKEGIGHCDNLHDHGRKAILYMNLGNVYREVKNDTKAKEAFQMADRLSVIPKATGEGTTIVATWV